MKMKNKDCILEEIQRNVIKILQIRQCQVLCSIAMIALMIILSISVLFKANILCSGILSNGVILEVVILYATSRYHQHLLQLSAELVREYNSIP